MNKCIIAFALAALAGCGVETASTAATAAQIKAREIEEAKKTQQRAQGKIDQATQQMYERAQKSGDSDAR